MCQAEAKGSVRRHRTSLIPALTLLADLPGITVTGTVTDRAGRTGEAFSSPLTLTACPPNTP